MKIFKTEKRLVAYSHSFENSTPGNFSYFNAKQGSIVCFMGISRRNKSHLVLDITSMRIGWVDEDPGEDPNMKRIK